MNEKKLLERLVKAKNRSDQKAQRLRREYEKKKAKIQGELSGVERVVREMLDIPEDYNTVIKDGTVDFVSPESESHKSD